LKKSVISVEDVVTGSGETIVHDHISLSVNEGEIYGLLGFSGSGKSTLLKEMIMLLRPQSGSIQVLGNDVLNISSSEAVELKKRFGVLFQSGALFSSLNVAENIGIALKEYTDLPKELIDIIVKARINMVGLPEHAGALYPSELSGGMIKRVALARALSMDPEILFLDEPTSGLDPVGAEEFEQLIVGLRDLLGFTVVMVTHDIHLIMNIVDRFSVLFEHKVIAEGSFQEVTGLDHPVINKFFKGAKGTMRLSK
jgi:phospholipid/cholesterol/gamma-HCH transport system ATP-binding protein